MKITAYQKYIFIKLRGILLLYFIGFLASLLFVYYLFFEYYDLYRFILTHSLIGGMLASFYSFAILVILVIVIVYMGKVMYQFSNREPYKEVRKNIRIITILLLFVPLTTALIVNELGENFQLFKLHDYLLVGTILFFIVNNIFFAFSKRAHVYFQSNLFETVIDDPYSS